MFKLRALRRICNTRLQLPLVRHFHEEFTQKDPLQSATTKSDGDKETTTGQATLAAERTTPKMENTVAGAIRHKYQIFDDADASEIFDVEEERERYQTEEEQQNVATYDEFYGLNLQHGKHGVFDIEDLVEVLRKERAEDVFVCTVEKELKYVDYIVICNGRSFRHMLSIAEFVRRMFKVKRNKGEIIPKIEGEKSRKWMAMDLGNIALHIFSPEAREEYNLETLWAIGAEYDKEILQPEDPLVELFENNATEFSKINPTSKATEH